MLVVMRLEASRGLSFIPTVQTALLTSSEPAADVTLTLIAETPWKKFKFKGQTAYGLINYFIVSCCGLNIKCPWVFKYLVSRLFEND